MVELARDECVVLNNLQGGLPVGSQPFQELQNPLGLPEDRIVETLRTLDQRGLLSRFGAVLNTRRMGGDSRLAAMRVPGEQFREVAEIVNNYRTVTHNYRRDHRLNMWFVLSASDPPAIDQTLDTLEEETGHRVFNLPKLTEYYVGLRFYFESDGLVRTVSMENGRPGPTKEGSGGLTPRQREVVVALQDGLPITRSPFASLAAEVGLSESAVHSELRVLLRRGIIKRLGCIPNHYALGIRGNGMAVFDVPSEEVDRVGRRVGQRPEVTHCYRRPRHGNLWPYNLFAMVHDRTREKARKKVEGLREEVDLEPYDYDVLFSEELLKKTGLRLTPRSSSERSSN